MGDGAPTEQEVVIHFFAHAQGPPAAQGTELVGELWAHCRDRLGAVDAVPGLGLPVLSGDLRSPSTGPLAAVQRPDTHVQALLRREHDVFGLSVLLAWPGADWQELDRAARDLIGEPGPGLVGVATIYLGKTPGGDPVTASAQLGMLAAGQLPAAAQQDGWWRHGVESPFGGAVWDLDPWPDDRVRRHLLVLAPSDRDAAQSGWTWSDGTVALAPFARYQMHTAKLRYQMRVHAGFPLVTDLCAAADERMAVVAARGGAVPDELLADRARIVRQLAALRAMRRTVEIADANAAAVVGAGPDDPGPVPEDRAAAAAFATRLDDDIAYLMAADEGLRDLATLAARAGPPDHDRPLIFVNYRVQENAGYARLLYNELTRRFGRGSVFMAAASIRAGEDWRQEVLERLDQCEVVLAVMGSRWLRFRSSPRGYGGFGPGHDWVRYELAEAFRQRKHVIPILVEDAEVPTGDQLPKDIAQLATRQGVRLRHYGFEADLAAIVAGLVEALGVGPTAGDDG